MTRKLIAFVAAAAIAATGFSAAPAQARDRGETAAIIAGAAALAIVGATLASDRNNKKHRGHVSRSYNRGHGYHAAPPPHARAYGYRMQQRKYGYRPHSRNSYRPYYGSRSHGDANRRSGHRRW